MSRKPPIRGRALEPSSARRAPGSLAWTCAIGVFAVTWIVFRSALAGGWLDWDDAPLLRENEAWRGLSFAHLRWMFTTFHMGPYQPLSWMSYALDHALWGMDPRGYHLTNVLLHAASAGCLVLLARELFARIFDPAPVLDIAAAFSALFWSIHPLRVESVAWITERRDCLSGLFFVLALLSWLRCVDEPDPNLRRRRFRFAVALFTASLLAKGLGMVLPFLLLALDVWPLQRFAPGSGLARARELLLEKWPFWLLGLAAAVLAVVGQSVTGAVVQGEYHGPAARVAQAFYGLAFYVRKTIWPSDLMVLYPMRVPLDVGAPRFVLSAIAVVAAVALLALFRRKLPAAVVACACYVTLVAPVLGLTQTGSQLVADRYSYLASLPLSLLAGGVVLLVARKIDARAALIPAFALLAPIAVLTLRQIRVWSDTAALWEHDLSIDPDDHPARRSLIETFLNRGRDATDPLIRAASFARALAECQKGMEQGPDPVYLCDAAKVHDLMSDEGGESGARHLETALEFARRAVALDEATVHHRPEIYESCGAILCKLGRPGEAVPYFEKLVQIDTTKAERFGMLADALIQSGRPREALAPLESARRLAPDSTAVWIELGEAHRRLGERAAALDAYRRVVQLEQARLGPAASSEDLELARRAIGELETGR